MGFRFLRRIKIAPGLRVNLSRSGVSASVGRRGAWFTIGPRGTREAIGIPGTGISYTEEQRAGAEHIEAVAPSAPTSPQGASSFRWIAVILAIAGAAILLALLP
jgi:hypothetical protein